jgi:SAM-dependent methyltransferase
MPLQAFCGQMAFDREYFKSQYRDYERQNPARKLAFYRRLVEMGAGDRKTRPRILDIGCAYGLFLSNLGDGWERYGEDASEYAIQVAREKSPSIHFELSLSESHPFAGPFDIITAFDVLEHILKLEELLDWIYKGLVPGGAFIFVVPVYDGPTGPIIEALDRDPTHVHKWGRQDWLELAGRRFQLVNWWGIYRYLLPGGLYMHVVTRSLRRLTPAAACLMRRG